MNFLEDSSYHSPTMLCTLPMGKFSNLTTEEILECLHALQIMYPLLSLLGGCLKENKNLISLRK